MALLRKMTCNLRHSMSLLHPVLKSLYKIIAELTLEQNLTVTDRQRMPVSRACSKRVEECRRRGRGGAVARGGWLRRCTGVSRRSGGNSEKSVRYCNLPCIVTLEFFCHVLRLKSAIYRDSRILKKKT